MGLSCDGSSKSQMGSKNSAFCHVKGSQIQKAHIARPSLKKKKKKKKNKKKKKKKKKPSNC